MVKKNLLPIAAVLSLALVGCGPKPPAQANVPDFIANPPHEAGKIFGTAEAQKKSFQLAKEVADSRACKEIAQKLGRRVQDLTKDFMEQSGQDKTAEYLEFSNVASKFVTDQNLSGCEIAKRDVRQDADGVTVYSLAYVDKNTAQNAVHAAMEAARSRAASKLAFDDLDRAVQANLDK